MIELDESYCGSKRIRDKRGREDKVIQWRSRPLDEIYPIVYLDGIVIKARQDKQIIRKTMYIALGINFEGRKECLGLWL